MSKNETVEEFLVRGGEITKCKTYGIKKHSSILLWSLHHNTGIGKTGTVKRKQGVDAQELLDAAAGTKDESAVVAFLEEQGYEVN